MLPASAGMSQTSEKEEREENKEEEQKENKGASEAYLGPEDMFDLSNCGKPSKGISILTNTLVLRFYVGSGLACQCKWSNNMCEINRNNLYRMQMNAGYRRLPCL